MRSEVDEGPGWAATVVRGRVLLEEARCRTRGAGPLDAAWLATAATWLAEVAPAWERMAGAAPDRRSYRSICASTDLEAWLIAWPAGGRLELHDHGGAPGALRVVQGRLEEAWVVAGPPAASGCRPLRAPAGRRAFERGQGPSFAGAGAAGEYVHDVRNPGGPVATSVHVYGRATRPMGFYRLDGGVLVPLPAERDDAAVVPSLDPPPLDTAALDTAALDQAALG